MDSTEDVTLLVRWYERYGRLPELDLNHARALLAHIFPSH